MKPILPWYFKVVNGFGRTFGTNMVSLDAVRMFKQVMEELHANNRLADVVDIEVLVSTLAKRTKNKGQDKEARKKQAANLLLEAAMNNHKASHAKQQQLLIDFTRYVNAVSQHVSLSMCGRIFFKMEAKSILRERLRVELYHHFYPDTKNIKIEAPIVILGLPRTGSTFLSRLLSCDQDNLRPLLFWEANRPAPELDTRGRVIRNGKVKAGEELDMLTKTIPNFKIIHEMGNEEHEECMFILRQTFVSWLTALSFDVPEFRDYLKTPEAQELLHHSYTHHKRALQVLMAEEIRVQSQGDKKSQSAGQLSTITRVDSESDKPKAQTDVLCPSRSDTTLTKATSNPDSNTNTNTSQQSAPLPMSEVKYGKRWLLKSPYHMFGADALMEQYPGVKMVWLHRLPEEVYPSFSSLIGLGRPVYSADATMADVGRDVSEVLNRGLNQLEGFRNGLDSGATSAGATGAAGASGSFLDIGYTEIIESPMTVVDKIYTFAGLVLSESSRSAMLDYIASHPQHQHGKHKYTLEDFGLSAEEVRRDLTWYHRKYDAYLQKPKAAESTVAAVAAVSSSSA